MGRERIWAGLGWEVTVAGTNGSPKEMVALLAVNTVVVSGQVGSSLCFGVLSELNRWTDV